MARKPAENPSSGEEAKLPPPDAAELAATTASHPAGESQAVISAGAAADGGPVQRVEKATAAVISPIEHDGLSYAIGDPIDVTREEFVALVKAGAVQDEDWDELANPF